MTLGAPEVSVGSMNQGLVRAPGGTVGSMVLTGKAFRGIATTGRWVSGLKA